MNEVSSRKDWAPVTARMFWGGMGVCALFAYFAHGSGHWVPLVDGTNLLFHEAGHPIFGMLSSRLAVYGGTLGQMAFPIGIGIHFYKQGHSGSFFACWVWLSENLWNIAVYMADARAQALPLVGSGDHDWTEIFTRWGSLAQDARIAGFTRGLGWALMIAACAWFYSRWRETRGDGE